MSSADVHDASLPEPKLIAMLSSFAGEMRATGMRILAYLCGVAVLALIATDIASRLQDDIDLAPRPLLRQSTWQPVERPIPAFATPSPDLAVSDVNVPQLATEGDFIDVSWTVTLVVCGARGVLN